MSATILCFDCGSVRPITAGACPCEGNMKKVSFCTSCGETFMQAFDGCPVCGSHHIKTRGACDTEENEANSGHNPFPSERYPNAEDPNG